MLGQEDRANVSRRIREGWELVRGTDLPEEWRSLPTMDNGRHEGVVYNEGLLLAKIPNETVEEREPTIRRKAKKPLMRWTIPCSTKPVAIAVMLNTILSEIATSHLDDDRGNYKWRIKTLHLE